MAKLDEDNGGVLSNVERARQQLVDKQLEYKDVQQQILQATQSIPSIKKETQELDMQIAMVEAQLTQVRQQWKQAEDMKVDSTHTYTHTQSQPRRSTALPSPHRDTNRTCSCRSLTRSLCHCCVDWHSKRKPVSCRAGRNQAGKLLREKQEVQEMLDQAQLELSKMKNQGQLVKDNMPQLQGSIKDMRDNLSELHELIAEGEKEPNQRASEVQVGQNGQLVLGAARSTATAAGGHSAVSKMGSVGGGRSAAAALGLDDEDDAFAVPDIPLPTAGTRTPITMLSPSAATAGRLVCWHLRCQTHIRRRGRRVRCP